MANNNDDILRSMKLFEGKETKKDDKKVEKKKEEKLDEFKMKPTPDSKKGMFKGKPKSEIRKELASVKARMKSIEDSGKKVPKALRTKFSELTFALRAKNDWGKAESKENKPAKKAKVVKESFNFETAIDKMLAENFWGGEEDGSQDGGSSSMGSSEEGGESPLGNGHEHDEESSSDDSNEHEDVLKIDVPTFIKFLEFAREDSTGDDELHELAEKLVQCCGEGETINMEKFEEICCMNHDGGQEVGANSEAGQEDHENPDYGNDEDSGSGESEESEESDSDSGSGEEEMNESSDAYKAGAAAMDSYYSGKTSEKPKNPYAVDHPDMAQWRTGAARAAVKHEKAKSNAPKSVSESMRILINRLN